MKSRVKVMAIAGLAALLLYVIPIASADTPTKSITMLAKLSGKGFGVARVDMTTTHRTFRMKVHTIPNATLVIGAQRGKQVGKFGWVRTDKFGHGAMVLDSRKDQWIPVMHEEDTVIVWLDNTVIMSGKITLLNRALHGR